jgi:hypothetical protein
MRFMRFVLGFVLSVLLLGVATLRAQSNPTPGAPPSHTYLSYGERQFWQWRIHNHLPTG